MTELPASFGKYFLTEKLATGGMAEIYLGKLVGPGGFEKQLVIKQIHPTLAAEAHFVDLFVAEAKTLVGLSHGNIVPVYELGIVDDTYFIAMEYIDGPTLYRFTEAVWRAGDAIAPDVAAYIAARILEGLDYAHRRGDGVIHRDLSPRNVMLSRDGEVKLVDFGIAVAFGTADDATSDGAPTGSFPYMSPEQVERRPLTTASDLFSAGVLLWEMLAGQRLFAHATAEATLDAVVNAPIAAPSSVRPGVPKRLDEVVLRALERDVGKRWAGAGDFLAALHRHLYSPEAEQVPTARRLAQLVAKYCPPIVETTETAPSTNVEPAAPAGPSTVVVPRKPAETEPAAVDDGATQVNARGKPRGSTVREQSFATHVELDAVMSGTPLFGVRALRDEPIAPPVAPERATTVSGETHVRPRRSKEIAAAAETATTLPRPASLRGWQIAVVVLASTVAALVIWRLLADDRAPAAAPAPAPDAARAVVTVDAAAPPAIDAAVVDAGVDAAADAEPDAGRRPPIDAGRPVRIDAGVKPPIDAAARAMGTIKVGADPWGKVSIDNKPVGNAPNQWPVVVGKHVVEVTHPDDAGGPDQKQTFHVDVQEDEIESVFADFTP